jgi:hypothetical protein
MRLEHRGEERLILVTGSGIAPPAAPRAYASRESTSPVSGALDTVT